GVLRESGNGNAPLEPSPDLGAVEALIGQARGTGLEVRLEVEGERPERVPEAVQLAAFRILQESLTNVRRHAPGAVGDVNLAYCADRLLLSIQNDGAHTGNGGASGVGIVGMRERAGALGGKLEAQRSGERFRVVAELPYRRSV